MKNVRKPQESVAKVVAVESRTGSWARVSPDYVPKKNLQEEEPGRGEWVEGREGKKAERGRGRKPRL